MAYLDIARKKRAQRQERIPKEWLLTDEQLQSSDVLDVPRLCGLLSDREVQITEHHDAVDIVESISSGKLSAKEVAISFCKRAAIAQQLVRYRPAVAYHTAF